MFNPWRQLLSLLPGEPVLVGTVSSISGGVATITLPGGPQTLARGDATVGETVFVKGGAIQGPAPSLTALTIDV